MKIKMLQSAVTSKLAFTEGQEYNLVGDENEMLAIEFCRCNLAISLDGLADQIYPDPKESSELHADIEIATDGSIKKMETATVKPVRKGRKA